MKLGRQPRKFDTRIPHLKTILRDKPDLRPLPLALDYSAGMPDFLGFMLNNDLGDCTCAAFYHAYQIWTGTAGGKMITEPDDAVLALYEGACGYNPSDPNTDQGGCEQDVLAYLLNNGAPPAGEKIIGYVEVDCKNLDTLKRTIVECGVAYIGIQVTQAVMDNAENNDIAWDAVVGDMIPIGGHAVILVGYDLDNFYAISWGKKYKITHNFMAQYLEEAYGIISQKWIDIDGVTPFKMTLAELEAQMQELKE